MTKRVFNLKSNKNCVAAILLSLQTFLQILPNQMVYTE